MARLSREGNPVLEDRKAVEIVEHLIEYDFETLDRYLPQQVKVGSLVRARAFDDTIRRFTAEHPRATVVNLGAGLDTSFFRVDNGLIRWYDLDFPDVIELRKRIIPESNRMKCIAKSLLDASWMKDIKGIQNGVLFFAVAVFCYLEERELRALLSRLARAFPGGEIAFDTIPAQSLPITNRIMKEAGLANAPLKWGIDDTKAIAKWDRCITLLEDYAISSRLEHKDFWGEQVAQWMDETERQRSSCLVHLGFRA